MEEARLNISATKQVHNVHTCPMPDVQKDVEFVMEHLNDPNFDLTQLPSSVVEESTKRYVGEDHSRAINVDESVIFYPSLLIHISNNKL
jgi:hypothetical protein